MLVALLALHAVVAVLAAATGRKLGRWVFWLGAVPPAATVAWAATRARGVIDGQAIRTGFDWAPAIGLRADFLLDAFALLMVALVSGIGTLIFVYAFYYFSHPRPDLGRFCGTLVAFAGAMLGLVTTDNLLLVFVFWELTSITSYLLIGFEHGKESARASALQALLVTGAGGLALLGGVVLLGQAAGTYSLSAILATPPTGAAVTAAALCFLAGIVTKSAQVPFHTWLPAAMAAPTPVSAYLHSATMVKAGVYLAARVAPMFALTVTFWRPLVVSIGILTMLVGGYRALRQYDLKLVLAYGTISQLGFMLALVGAGTPEATFGGVAVLLAHGIFKAALFMVVGVVDHETGTRDLRELSGAGRQLKGAALAAAVAAASMAGLPPLTGFIAKEAALEAFTASHMPSGFGGLWLAGLVVGSVLTFAYSFRVVWGAFARKEGVPETHAHRAPLGFWAPAGLLAVLSILFGLAPALDSPLVVAATSALDPLAHPHPLALWHGITLPLLLTAVIVVAGAILIVARRQVERAQEALPHVPGANEGYHASVRGLQTVAGRTTAVVQPGSLPIYLAVILVVLIALPTVQLAQGSLAWAPDRFADSWLQVVAAAVAVVGSFGVAFARRRFAAVLALGAVGYGVVTLFALHGAPDLSLTQLLIETLGLVVFFLALRHLPERFAASPWRLGQALRWVISLAMAVFVAGFGLIAGAARTAPKISEEFLARAHPEGGGRNVVNVVLVDIRGLDTLGEITVLAVAALGIAALVLAPRNGAGAPDDGAGDGVGSGGARAEERA